MQDQKKKDEQNKLTSVTYDSIETPGGVANLLISNTRLSKKGKFPEPNIYKSITKSKEGFIFEDHRSLEEMTQL